MNLNIKLSEEQMLERQRNIARLKENELIQLFLNQNHLDASFVEPLLSLNTRPLNT